MSNINLTLEVELEAHLASEKVYQNYLKTAVCANKHDGFKMCLFRHLLNKEDFIIPDSVFNWMAKDATYVSYYSMCSIIDEKKRMDYYIDSVLNIFRNKKIDYVNYEQLDRLLTEHALERHISHKIYILNLLSEHKIKGASFLFYPVENIMKNHRKLESCIDEFICEAAYMANPELLKTFISALTVRHITYKFDPSIKEKHSNILKWINKNISIGEQKPDTPLGWTCGPDSARWPSTKLDDYKETLALLNTIS